MQTPRRSLVAASLVTLALSATAMARPPVDVPSPPLPLATPQSQGMSAERLGRLHAEVQRFVDEGRHAGAISLIARNGRIVDWQAYGKRDVDGGLPMERDTICRIYSMSKIVTSVAALLLLEEARYRLDDPVGTYLPALGHMKVMTGGTEERPLLADAKNPITVKQLFTHTSGLTYDFGDASIDRLYKAARIWESPSLDEFVTRLSTVPLVSEPGERYTYSVSIDVLGALVEKLSGRTLPEFMSERLFRPLGMKDTGFFPLESSRSRIATVYERGPDGRLQPAKGLRDEDPRTALHVAPTLASGGGGLYSTTGDYARFMQMLLNGGQLDGVRILSRKTVELMMANHLNHMPRITYGSSESDGFGLGGAVRLDLAKGNLPGSVGQFGWSGAATTYANLDPQERMVSLLFVQHFPFDEQKIFWRFSTLAYAAIAD
jgi:CubicO group peptidase (beta-lactamase class C family)